MTDDGRADPPLVRVKVDLFEWQRLLRRVVIPTELDPVKRKGMPGAPAVKFIAFIASTYANSDGSQVRPGVERLMAVTGLGKSAVERSLRRLVDLGLFDQVVVGSKLGRKARASVYQLTIPEDILDRLELLPPDELEPEQQAPAPCGQPAAEEEQQAPAPGDRAAPVADQQAPAPGDRVEQQALAPRSAGASAYPPVHDQPQPQPHQQLPRPPVTRPTREAAGLWTAKVDPGLGEHPARGVVRVPRAADPSHPGSSAHPIYAGDVPTVLLPAVALADGASDPVLPGRRPALRLVHSTPSDTRRPA